MHGGGALTRELIAQCPSLGGKYLLPAWCTNAHVQTLSGYLRMFTIFLEYDRQLVTCADGGQVGLDWLVHARFAKPAPVPPTPPGRAATQAQTFGHPPQTQQPASPLPPPPSVAAHNIPKAADLSPDAPVFIMLHGINGGSHEGHTKWAIAAGAVRGWRCVALNLRGCNGVLLTSPKVYCAASSEDVRAAVNAARAQFPAAPILLAGYSLGTYIIGTYLAEEDSKHGGDSGAAVGRNGVAGAVLISCPLDPHSSHAGLRDPSRPAGMAYNSAIASELRRYFLKHKEVVGEHPDVHDGLELSDLRNIQDFEKALIIKTHGFADLEEYYEYISPARLIPWWGSAG